MASENSQDRASWPIAYGEAPKEGSRSMLQQLNFAIQNPILINLTSDQEKNRLEFVEVLYVNNSANPNPLIIGTDTTGQSLTIPAGWMGYVPVLSASSNPSFSFTTVTANIIIPVHFISCPMPSELWAANGSSSGGSVGTNFSSTAGNAAAAAVILANLLLSTVPVNAQRNYLEVQNQSLDTIYIVRDDGAGGNISMTILDPGTGVGAQGGSWTDEFFKGRLRVYTSVAGSQISVREE